MAAYLYPIMLVITLLLSIAAMKFGLIILNIYAAQIYESMRENGNDGVIERKRLRFLLRLTGILYIVFVVLYFLIMTMKLYIWSTSAYNAVR